MRSPNFSRREILSFGLMAAAGLGGLAIFIRFYDLAFPAASINMTVGRKEALQRSERFLRRQGFDLSGYRRAEGFHCDESDKEYLEKEIGLKRANQLMRDEVRVWHWHCRWFRPLHKEEFWVGLSPDGHLVGFGHTVEESTRGASLSPAMARTLAEQFLRKQQGLNLSDYRLMDGHSEKRPHRVDHDFVWERKGFKAKEATFRIWVTIQGAEVAGYAEFLKIPEAWQRAEARKSSRRGLLMSVASFCAGLLGLATFIVLLFKVRERQVRLRFGLAVGLVLATLVAISKANGLPMSWLDYRTTEPQGAFLGQYAISILMGLIGTVFMVLALALPAEALAREVFPEKLPISHIFTKRFWSSKEVFTASFIGCCLAGLMGAYATLFYIIGYRFGVWAPLEVRYSDILATPLPWIYPLTIGMSAAVFEELLFRLFAISLLLRLLKRRWLAIMLPAILWAFLHSNYPQEPIYIRGIEISVVGIVEGLLFLRFGFLCPFIAHYAYDALSVSMILLQTHQPYLQISGAVVVALMLAPLLPGALVLLRRGSLATTEAILAGQPEIPERTAEDIPAGPSSTPVYETFTPLSRSRYWVLGASAASALLLCIFQPVKERFGDFVQVTVNRKQAQAIADDYLQSKGIAVGRFHRVTTFNNGLQGEAIDYLYQRVGSRRLNELCRDRLRPGAYWRTRYFIPLQEEGYWVTVSANGVPFGYTHALEEKAAGARLTHLEARRRAEAYLRREKRMNLDHYRLVEDSTQKREKRTDHYFTWEDKTTKIGEGTFRLYLTVQGDEVMNFTNFLKVPERWQRERQERGLKDTIINGVFGIAGLAFFIYCVVLFTRAFARREINWRLTLPISAGVALLSLLIKLNELPDLWSGYSTSTPPSIFITRALIGYCTLPVGMFLCTCAMLGLGESLFRHAYPRRRPLPHWLGETWVPPAEEEEEPEPSRLPVNRARLKRAIWGEALVIACLVSLAVVLFVHVNQGNGDSFDWLSPHKSVRDHAPTAHVVGGYTSFCPAGGTMLNALAGTVFLSAILMGAVGLYRRVLKRPRWLFLFVTVMALLGAGSEAGDWLDFAKTACAALLGLGIVGLGIWAGIRWILRDNLAAYASVLFMSSLLGSAVDMLSVPNAAVRANGVALLGLFCLLSAVGVWLLVKMPVGPEDGANQRPV